MMEAAAPEVVIDGLSYQSEGYGEELAKGGVTAFHVTVCPFQAEFEEAMDHIAAWYARIEKDPRLLLVRHVDDLFTAAQSGRVGVILGTQNARPVGSYLPRIQVLKALGVHILQLTYMERNFYGDGCLEHDDAGLSKLGRAAVREMQRCGVTVDLSHVGHRTTMEALAMAERPMVFTHANCKALCDMARNKTDEEIKALAATGGVIGFSPYSRFLWHGPGHGRPTLDDYVAHIEHAVELVGIDHVAIGTDSPIGLPREQIDTFIKMMNTTYAELLGPYINTVGATFEHRYAEGFVGVGEIPNLRQKLRSRGYAGEAIAKLVGGNWVRVFRDTWGRQSGGRPCHEGS